MSSQEGSWHVGPVMGSSDHNEMEVGLQAFAGSPSGYKAALSEVSGKRGEVVSLKADSAGIWGSIRVTKDGQAGFTTME